MGSVKTITIDHLTRVEGHGKLRIDLKNKKAEKIELNIIEGARMFEAWLRGRKFNEVPHLASRICAICSPSHTITAINALENALEIQPTEQTKKLREIAILGSTIQSHVLHMYLLSLPDYLGFDSVISMAKKFPNEVKSALRMKKMANEIVDIVAGRAVHQISFEIDRVTKIPTKKETEYMLDQLKKLRTDALKSVELFGGLKYPNFKRPTEYLALRSPKEYAFTNGDIVSSEGKSVPISKWESFATEQIVSYSTAKQGIRNGHGYMVGPLARVNLNYKQLSDATKTLIQKIGIKLPNQNPFLNNYARALELLHCFDRLISILENSNFKSENNHKIDIRSGNGYGATEAPRGTLYHHYEIDHTGAIKFANILTPTAQNLLNIEEDLYALIPSVIDKPKENLTLQLEMAVRNYDPCISCSTHFLEIEFI